MAWDAKATAERNKRSTLPVSAFFLIDSREAMRKCIEQLSRLREYGFPDMAGSGYFEEVWEIFESKRVVRNFDHRVAFQWQGQEHPGVIRAHTSEAGLEIELWLPGVIAADAAGMFSDGRTGFFCAFQTPAYYD